MTDRELVQQIARRGAAHERAPRRRLGIMVVDDECSIRNMLGEWFRLEGFSVWLAATGQMALELFSRHEEEIDVVLMDVRMPGLDGPTTFVALKIVDPQICCCFMSGNLGGHTVAELISLGAARVIAKPFSLDDVTRTLIDLARRRVREPAKSLSSS